MLVQIGKKEVDHVSFMAHVRDALNVFDGLHTAKQDAVHPVLTPIKRVRKLPLEDEIREVLFKNRYILLRKLHTLQRLHIVMVNSFRHSSMWFSPTC